MFFSGPFSPASAISTILVEKIDFLEGREICKTKTYVQYIFASLVSSETWVYNCYKSEKTMFRILQASSIPGSLLIMTKIFK